MLVLGMALFLLRCDASVCVLRCQACSATEKVSHHKLSLHNANIRYRKVVRKYCSCDVKTLSLLCRQLPFKKGSLLIKTFNEGRLCKMCEAFFRGAPCPRAPFGQRGAAHGGFAAARFFGGAETRGAPY